MAGTRKRKLERAGAEMRVADIREKFRTASRSAQVGGKAERSEKTARSDARPQTQEAMPGAGDRSQRREKDGLSERDRWLQRNEKQNKKARRGSGGGYRLDRGVSYFLLLSSAIGGGVGFGLIAEDLGSIELAARHLVAAPHCEVARLVGMTDVSRGEPGYWAHHDPDGAGVSCTTPLEAPGQA